MVAPLIDHDHRRRLVVARHLLESPGRSDRAVTDVTATHPLLHSTDPSTPHLSIHARSGATIRDIDDAFYEQRDLLRHTSVRPTVFAMPLDVVPLADGAANAPIIAKLRGNLVAWIDASPDPTVPGGRPDGSIVTLVHEDVGAAERNEIDREVERTTAWLAGTRVPWRYPTRFTGQLEAD